MVHSFLVLISSAVLLLLSAAVAALPCDVHFLFFSFCFFRACAASVRYDMFVWQEGECLSNMALHLLLGPLLPFPITGCLVAPGCRSRWHTAAHSHSGAHSCRRSYARVLFSEVLRTSSLLGGLTHEFSSRWSHAWVLCSTSLYPVVGRRNTMTCNISRLELRSTVERTISV